MEFWWVLVSYPEDVLWMTHQNTKCSDWFLVGSGEFWWFLVGSGGLSRGYPLGIPPAQGVW
jgi:hypothetical protein